MATYTIRNTSVQDWRDTMMSKAEFNALAAERRANRAGSGFDEWGKHYNLIASFPNVNDGMFTLPTQVNGFKIGWRDSSSLGSSKTLYPIVSINGIVHRVENLNNIYLENLILLPPAPTVLPYDATLTPEQIAMGVIKHADASNSGLIVNGKFDTDTSGWSVVKGDELLSISSGAMLVTIGTNDSGRAQQIIPTTIGKKYIVEGYIKAGTSNNNDIRVADSTNSVLVYSTIVSNTSDFVRVSVEFTATQTTHKIWLMVNSTLDYATAYFDNIAVFPADAISRSDLVFLESWHEDVSEKDFVYPLGNTQYLGGTTDGMSAIVAGSFSGYGTYSLFGNWQASGALVGKGYVWSGMSDAQKKAFVSNPENNCYLDGDKVIQVRYRVRVVAGMGDSWTSVNDISGETSGSYATALRYFDSRNYVQAKGKLTNLTSDFGSTLFLTYGHTASNRALGTWSTDSTATNVSYEGKCYALPIALVHR